MGMQPLDKGSRECERNVETEAEGRGDESDIDRGVVHDGVVSHKVETQR